MNKFTVLWRPSGELDTDKIKRIRDAIQLVEKKLIVIETAQNQGKCNLALSVSQSLCTTFERLIIEFGTWKSDYNNPAEDIVYINKIEFDNITLFDLFDDKRRAFEEEKRNVEEVLSEFKVKISADYRKKAEVVLWWLSERIIQLKTQRNDTTDTKNETIKRIRDRFRQGSGSGPRNITGPF